MEPCPSKGPYLLCNVLCQSLETLTDGALGAACVSQAVEGKIEGLKKQQGQELKREAHLAAEAEAHKRSIADRDQALRSAAQETRTSALPQGALSQSQVDRQATHLLDKAAWASVKRLLVRGLPLVVRVAL